MTSLTLYGLRNCDTCRKALNALQANDHDVTFIDIRSEAPLDDLVPRWLAAIGAPKLINTRSTTWRGLSDAERQSAASDPAALLIAHPALIKRPVIVAGDAVHVGWDSDSQRALT